MQNSCCFIQTRIDRFNSKLSRTQFELIKTLRRLRPECMQSLFTSIQNRSEIIQITLRIYLAPWHNSFTSPDLMEISFRSHSHLTWISSRHHSRPIQISFTLSFRSDSDLATSFPGRSHAELTQIPCRSHSRSHSTIWYHQILQYESVA